MLGWLVLGGVLACSAPTKVRDAHEAASADATAQVQLLALVPGVWIHTSFKTLPQWGRVASNGLLVCRNGQGTLIDTAFTTEQTSQLLALADKQGCPVRALVVTHHHDDRMGGLPVIRAAGIATYARAQTVALAQVEGWSPTLLGDDDAIQPAGTKLQVYYPGAGHTVDNAVVWLPEHEVLFGGCLVRALDNRALGNLQDANVAVWPATIARVQARYGAARQVVPGHGAAGDAALLAHTATLAEAGK